MKPHNDPKMNLRGFYRDFLLRLQGCGILTFLHRARGKYGKCTKLIILSCDFQLKVERK